MSYKQLPSEYLERMKASLNDDFEAFLRTYDEEPVKGLRFNPRRVRTETVEELVRKWRLEPVPWCKDGYYYQENADDSEADTAGGTRVLRPGLSPYHDAGVFYIQEPSAMITASSADIRETDVVLDLCAAPGGKSTQAAALAGLLVSNEPIANRARILSSNIERMGFANTVVTSAWPDELAKVCGAMFDRIIVDAPCSGEGMMRKDETAVEEWSPANVALCIERQAEILEAADEMLKAGGKLTYSTCTFEYGENEGQIRHFLEAHPGYTLLDMHLLYPHEIRGEGHFCAVLQKGGTELQEEMAASAVSNTASSNSGKRRTGRNLGQAADGSGLPDPAALAAFLKKKKIHVLRAGIEPGETKQDRKGKTYYTPSHAEAMAKDWETDTGAKLNICSMEMCLKYLHGEALDLTQWKDAADPSEYDFSVCGGDGWLTVYYDRYPLGLGKRTGNTIKNHYPKGLRHL